MSVEQFQSKLSAVVVYLKRIFSLKAFFENRTLVWSLAIIVFQDDYESCFQVQSMTLREFLEDAQKAHVTHLYTEGGDEPPN